MAKVFWAAVNTEKYHPASSPATKHTSNGHGFHRKHYQLGTVFWWICQPERWIPIRPRFKSVTSLISMTANESKSWSVLSHIPKHRLWFVDVKTFPDWSLIRSWHITNVWLTCLTWFPQIPKPMSLWHIVLKIPGLMSLNTQKDGCVRHILMECANQNWESLNTSTQNNDCLCEPQSV